MVHGLVTLKKINDAAARRQARKRTNKDKSRKPATWTQRELLEAARGFKLVSQSDGSQRQVRL